MNARHATPTDLVTRARTGDQQAWDALVDRYNPLVWAICRHYRLSAADAQDASQSVWLHLVEHLDGLRDPAALPGWLATTTRRECARVLRAAHHPQAAALVPDAGNTADQQAQIPDQELLAAERHATLRQALTRLPPRGQQLLTLLTHDPPMPYAQISATLGIPVGSIGPLRSRYLHKLRKHPAIAALINADATPPVPASSGTAMKEPTLAVSNACPAALAQAHLDRDRVQPHRRVGDQAVGQMMTITEAAVSLVIGILVIARAVNILK